MLFEWAEIPGKWRKSKYSCFYLGGVVNCFKKTIFHLEYPFTPTPALNNAWSQICYISRNTYYTEMIHPRLKRKKSFLMCYIYILWPDMLRWVLGFREIWLNKATLCIRNIIHHYNLWIYEDFFTKIVEIWNSFQKWYIEPYSPYITWRPLYRADIDICSYGTFWEITKNVWCFFRLCVKTSLLFHEMQSRLSTSLE